MIDGFMGMEGNGPVAGSPVQFRIAAASAEPVSLDAVVAKALGFDPLEVGYLYHLSDWGFGVIELDRIEVRGLPLESARRLFKPHSSYREQLNWK